MALDRCAIGESPSPSFFSLAELHWGSSELSEDVRGQKYRKGRDSKEKSEGSQQHFPYWEISRENLEFQLFLRKVKRLATLGLVCVNGCDIGQETSPV